MESAIFGLIGVVLGAVLTVIKEWWFKHRTNQKESEYLAILVTFALERFAVECVHVVNDDGLFQGQYNSDGRCSFQVPTPNFNPHAIDVEWKSIPAELMYEIFHLVNELDAANHRISGIFENGAGPPDYEDCFEERQLSYANLGIEALKLADRLRAFCRLPKREPLEWDPADAIITRKREVEASRTHRLKRQGEWMRSTLELSMGASSGG